MTRIVLAALDFLSEGVVIVAADLTVAACNRRAREILKLSPQSAAPGVPLAQLFDEAARRGILGDGDPAGRARLALDCLADASMADATPLAPGITASRLGEEGFVLVVSDLNTLDIRQRCAELEEAFEHLPQGVTMLDRNLDMAICNSRFNQMMSIPPDLGRRGTSFETFMRFNAERGEYGPGDIDELVSQRVAAARRRLPHRFTRERPDGTAVEVHGVPLPQGGFVSSYVDVTERQKATAQLRQMVEQQERLVEERTAELRAREKELSDKKALLEVTLEHMDQGITMFDADLRLVVCNAKAGEMLGFPTELFHPGASFEELTRYNAERGDYGPGDPEEQVRSRVELARNPQPHCFERVRPDGQVIEICGTPLAGGGFVTTFTDVTTRRQAEQRLQETLDQLERRVEDRTHALSQRERDLATKTALLEATVENISQGISLFDGELKLLVHNQKFLDLLGFPDELGGAGAPLEAMFRYNAERGEYGEGDVAAQVAERLEKARHPIPHKFRRVRIDGSVLEIQGNPLPPEIGGFVTTYADVTDLVRARELAERALAELKVAQEKLVQAEKMVSLGQLVAGVAHEINTPVGVALTAASFLEQETQKLQELVTGSTLRKSDLAHYGAIAVESTRSIQANLLRAGHLIQSFKQVAVDQTSQERRRFKLAGYIDETLLSLAPKLKKVPHQVIVDCPADLELDSYPGALSHVLTNLVVNALIHAFDDATPGILRIKARCHADQVIMAFTDDGKGIPPEHLGKIFDPFFTTRRGSGGSGLGLNVVYNSVTANLQGSISCDSRLGSGTTFTISFPVSVAAAEDSHYVI